MSVPTILENGKVRQVSRPIQIEVSLVLTLVRHCVVVAVQSFEKNRAEVVCAVAVAIRRPTLWRARMTATGLAAELMVGADNALIGACRSARIPATAGVAIGIAHRPLAERQRADDRRAFVRAAFSAGVAAAKDVATGVLRAYLLGAKVPANDGIARIASAERVANEILGTDDRATFVRTIVQARIAAAKQVAPSAFRTNQRITKTGARRTRRALASNGAARISAARRAANGVVGADDRAALVRTSEVAGIAAAEDVAHGVPSAFGFVAKGRAGEEVARFAAAAGIT